MSNKNVNIIKKDTYTVKEFCKKYNKLNEALTKNDFIKQVINPVYIPYENKITICNNIINISYYIKTEKNGNEIKKIYINSPSKHMLYLLNLVKHYTTIEIDFTKALENFNLLNECGFLDDFINYIPEKEVREFEMILNMVENDVIKNEYETNAYISNQVEKFGEIFGHVVEPAIKRLSEVLENMDEETIDKMADKLKGLNGLKGKFSILK